MSGFDYGERSNNKRGRNYDLQDSLGSISQMTNSQDSQDSQDETEHASRRARHSELPELNNALVVFANGMADVNNEIVQAPTGAKSDGEESVSSARSGSSASTDDTIDSNASSASTEIGAFFAPQLPGVNIDFGRVSDLFTNLATAFGDAATKVSTYAASTTTAVSELPALVRNQLTELSMVVSMLGLSNYMSDINTYMTTHQNDMINEGVNALLTSVSGIQSSLNSWLLHGGVGITLAVALLRSNIARSAITIFFTELSVTRAAVYDIMFTYNRSTDELNIQQNEYNRLKRKYQSAVEQLNVAIDNDRSDDNDIVRLERAVEAAKIEMEDFIDRIKSSRGPRGEGHGGKRQSQKKKQKKQQKQKQKQQQKSQKKPKRKLSKSKRAKKAKQSKKANKKH